MPVLTVKPGKLGRAVVASGFVEASENPSVLWRFESSAKILMLVPEGAAVKKGQIVCEMDPATLVDAFEARKPAIRDAEAAYDHARLNREIWEIAIEEYDGGTFMQGWKNVSGEVARAASEMKRAEDRVEWSDRMLAKGYVSKAQNIADKVSLQQKKSAHEQALNKMTVLERSIRDKTIKEFKAELEKARSDEKARQLTFEQEKSKVAMLERAIQGCKLLAPADGVVIYANGLDLEERRHRTRPPEIAVVATVRQGQVILWIADPEGPKVVHVRLPRPSIERVKVGQPARIRVDAFPGEVFPGKVEKVKSSWPASPRPDDPMSYQVYSTLVAIDRPPPGLGLDSPARVEILADGPDGPPDLDGVLAVPIPAVVNYDDKDHLMIRDPGGGYDWREVTLGLANGEDVEVTSGLRSGETVALRPLSRLTREEQFALFRIPIRPRPAVPRNPPRGDAAPSQKSGGVPR
jgi:multidrug efflux pump subunit AcrA (membrane-fusion protein)